MKKFVLFVIILVLLLGVSVVGGIVIENRFDLIKNSEKNAESLTEREYINMVKGQHERELAQIAYNFLTVEQKKVLDYSIKPVVEMFDINLSSNTFMYEKFPDGYYRVRFTADPKLFLDSAHNTIIIGIDAKDEDKVYMFPID